jgi:hypothetical protein
VPFDGANPDFSLRLLVDYCDAQNVKPVQIPKSFIDHFGMEVLANSLNLVFPELPDFDEAGDIAFLDSLTIMSYDSLCDAIATRPTDMDKLFCIFYWISRNIAYDADGLTPGRSYDHDKVSPERVFQNKKTVCAGYSNMFRDLAVKSAVSSFPIHVCSCVVKAFGWNQLHPPKTPESTHSAIIVIIDGFKWLCEPRWGAGTVDDTTKEFTFHYDRARFLVPLVRALHDHFMMDGSEQFLDWPLSYERFLRVPALKGLKYEFKSESHPFAWFDCPDGYLRTQFSTNLLPQMVCARCYVVRRNTTWELGSQLQHVELVKETSTRRRYWLHAVFSTRGLYEMKIFIDTELVVTFYVDSKRSNLERPFLSYLLGDSGFIPLCPKVGLSAVDSGVAVIRFAAAIKRSRLLVNVLNSHLIITPGLSHFCRLTIPFDDTRYEDVVTVAFPSDGRWSVQVYLSNDTGTYTQFTIYQFDVSGATGRKASPIEFVESNREFVNLETKSGLTISPASSAITIDHPVFQVTATFQGSLQLKFRPLDESKTIHPRILSQNVSDGKKTIEFELICPKVGNYELLYFWDNSCFTQLWRYSQEEMVAPTEESEKRMRDLQRRVEGTVVDEEFERWKNSIPNQPHGVMARKAISYRNKIK